VAGRALGLLQSGPVVRYGEAGASPGAGNGGAEPRCHFCRHDAGRQSVAGEDSNIPIVFVYVSDPVGAAVVTSPARPGGDTTGLLIYEESITGR
jgi:hypothetical protein